MTTQKAVTVPSQIGNGDKYVRTKGQKSEGRGSRDDGTSKVPDRGLKIRKV